MSPQDANAHFFVSISNETKSDILLSLQEKWKFRKRERTILLAVLIHFHVFYSKQSQR